MQKPRLDPADKPLSPPRPAPKPSQTKKKRGPKSKEDSDE